MNNKQIVKAADQANSELINEAFNHKQRRKMIREELRNQKYYISDHLGVSHNTNALKAVIKKEKNYKAWTERITRSHEMGKKLQRINTEQQYNITLQENQDREAKYLQMLIELYGENDGTKIHNEHLMKNDQRMNKKLGF